MKYIVTLFLIFFSFGIVAHATNPDRINKRENARVYAYIDGVYKQLKYKRGMKHIKRETFQKAYFGYLNLLEHGKLTNKRYLTVCDFSLSSNTNRLWLIDTRTKTVIINTLVAHGQATGEEYATRFSNIPESHQSSLGFFVTAQTYSGHNGYSMRMQGVDGNFNNRAMSRDIVMHGADYVSHAFARANKRLGRSWGCPSVSREMTRPIIDRIKNGSCLFIYHPTKSYLRSSFWLNNRVGRLPREAKNIITQSETLSKESEAVDVKTSPLENAAPEPVEKEDKSVLTIVEYEDPQEVQDLKNRKNVKIETVAVPEDQVTDEMRAKVLKKKKIVRKINKIIHLGKDSKEEKASDPVSK